jgi:hypothetical protein
MVTTDVNDFESSATDVAVTPRVSEATDAGAT